MLPPPPPAMNFTDEIEDDFNWDKLLWAQGGATYIFPNAT